MAKFHVGPGQKEFCATFWGEYGGYLFWMPDSSLALFSKDTSKFTRDDDIDCKRKSIF